MEKEKNYKILSIIFSVGILICFVGFTLSGVAMARTGVILTFFFGFGLCGILVAIFSSKAKESDSSSGVIHNSQVIKRCSCGAINDEDAIYCKKCGKEIDYQSKHYY